jgi:hypothetical protein
VLWLCERSQESRLAYEEAMSVFRVLAQEHSISFRDCLMWVLKNVPNQFLVYDNAHPDAFRQHLLDCGRLELEVAISIALVQKGHEYYDTSRPTPMLLVGELRGFSS